ncbi:hypothetical protein [Deinococcus roseus]|uniref:Uncharacterized protein n=1 Tax=Deinococcus roseus TaxID=392414 RepID=A0ABQ2D6P1_9DEIO|nr:hypothetical protein [Deinococcus roseus]GGJ47791.1 hypothetical protein GCM10008938_37220 [Deinococcus roseus]
MDNLEFVKQEQARRLLVLQTIYRDTIISGHRQAQVPQEWPEHGLDFQRLENIMLYLNDKGLIQIVRLQPMRGYLVQMTQYGIDEIETIVENPEKPTRFFERPTIQNNFFQTAYLQQGQDPLMLISTDNADQNE